MKIQALCHYKHGSVWSKDYDSAGGKKRFYVYIYMYNTQNKTKKQKITPPTPVPSPGEKGGGLCILHVRVLL